MKKRRHCELPGSRPVWSFPAEAFSASPRRYGRARSAIPYLPVRTVFTMPCLLYRSRQAFDAIFMSTDRTGQVVTNVSPLLAFMTKSSSSPLPNRFIFSLSILPHLFLIVLACLLDFENKR